MISKFRISKKKIGDSLRPLVWRFRVQFVQKKNFFSKKTNFFSNRLIDRYLRYRSFGDFKWLQLPNHKRWSSEIKKHKGFNPKGFCTLEMVWNYQIFDRTPGFRNSLFGSRIFGGFEKFTSFFMWRARRANFRPAKMWVRFRSSSKHCLLKKICDF